MVMDRDFKDLLSDKDRIYRKSFFDSLKSISLLEFRKNINMVQDIRPSLYLEDKVDNYYDELLMEYDNNQELFYQYEELLEFLKNNDYDSLENYNNFNYFVDNEIILQIQDFYHYSDCVALAYQYLKNCSNFKVSEIIIDGLFKDTIYNVWLNIKEMIRYNDLLSDDEKVLDIERINFYKTILEIDKMNCADKINLYQNIKSKNIAFIFYQDLNLIKKYSYCKIKNDLFRLNNKSYLLNDKESNKYNIFIYELNGEDFYMMVNCINIYSDTSSSIRNCYSLISSYNIDVYSKRRFIYGYTDFDINNIFHVLEKDACSADSFSSNSFTTPYVNRIMTSKQISNSSGYSEIQLLNKKIDYNIYKTIKPDYLVVFDSIEERHIMEAKSLGIPIIKINTSKYLSKIKDTYNRNNLGFDKLDRILDRYTNGSSLEKEKKLKRILT